MALPAQDTSGADDLAELERFVVENDDLLALEALVGRFNIFDALGIARLEIRHSNFLAFILDPAESHGQGQVFLKAVLMDLLKAAPQNLRPCSPIELDGIDLRGVVIKREWQHIDVLISCQQPPFVVVIENKVDSKEHSDQLSRYQATMKQHYSKHRPLYVYLTPDADEPSEVVWVPYSYQSLYSVLRRTRETYRRAAGDDVLVFLDHYLNLLGTRFMNESAESKRIDDLCQQIYKNHQRAIDLINARVGTSEPCVAELTSVLEGDGRWDVKKTRNGAIFLPKTWVGWLPKYGHKDDSWADPWWIHACLYSDRGKLVCCVHVARLADFGKRKEIVSKLLEEVAGCGWSRPRPKEIKDSLSRITAGERVHDWDEDGPDPREVREKVEKYLDKLYPRLEKLALVLKPLCKHQASEK